MLPEISELGPVFGHEAAKREFLQSAASGRLHHGWLLRGPRGIGKARLALQFALHLLGAGSEALAATSASRVGQRVLAGSHPDLRLIRRPVDDSGKVKAEIPAETVRALSEFFALRPAMGGWRVAIIDALDELNRFGLNAILKTLEEPPAQSVIFLISHGEQLVLPTIRSRCHEVRLSVLSEAEARAALALSGREGADADRLMRLSPGRPGRAAQMDGEETLAAAAAGEDVIRQLAAGDGRALKAALSLSSKSDAAFAATFNAIRMALEKRARNAPDAITAGNWADVALQIGRLEAEARALHQDRAQAIAAALTIAAPLLQSRPE
jgi:DNA polymerase-3 subunit delta'